MNQLSQTILETYQVRKTKAQKTAFIDLLRTHYPELKVEEGGMMKSRNLILGDLEQAGLVLTAHYDTVAEGVFPNLILPYRKGLKFAYTMLALLPIIAATLLCTWALAFSGASQQVTVLGALAVYYGLFFWKTFGGRPNPHTANDNTSGIITLLELYELLTPQQRKQVALVFFDNEEYGCVGSGWFYKQHKALMDEKLLINFDCVGDGDHFLLLQSKGFPAQWEGALRQAFQSVPGMTVVFDSAENASHSSDHKHFKHFLSVAAMHDHKHLGLFTGRIHTAKDTVLEPKNVEFLCRCTKSLVAHTDNFVNSVANATKL